MSFTDFFIRRPVFATSLSLMLMVMGLVAFTQLSVREFPKIDDNVISITTTYSGASASDVEGFITTPIENAISGVDGVDYITSTSQAGESQITINLELNSDITKAMVEVESDLSAVTSSLPSDIDDPVVTEVDSTGIPDLIITFSNDDMTPEAITDYLNRVVVPQLGNLYGVGSASVLGDRTYAMRIWLNPNKMAALHVTATDVEDALNDNNVLAQPGEIDRHAQLLEINVDTNISTAEAFGNMVVKRTGNKLIRLRDLGHVALGAEDYTTSVYSNGHSAVGLAVMARSDANVLQMADTVKNTLAQIKTRLPEGMKVAIPRDSSVYIQSSIDEVKQTLLEATVCVILIIFLFIGSVRSILIPVVTIPLSLISVCTLMYMLGYTINTLTLLAFVLAIGMVVDDAIVVLENIHRHIEKGMNAFQASLLGAREIGFAVIAMTLTLAAVYAPIGFTSGVTGLLFKEFAFTLASTVIISGFIALTLSPMMCSKIMKAGPPSRFETAIDRLFTRLAMRYTQALTWTIYHSRSLIVLLTITIFICGLLFFYPLYLKSGLAPDEDQGVIVGMAMTPTASRVNYIQKYTDQVGALYKQLPEQENYVIVNGHPNGENSAMAMLGLKTWSERTRSTTEIISSLYPQLQAITGIKMFVMNPPSLPTTHDIYPVAFVVKTTGSYDELNKVMQAFQTKVDENPGFARTEVDLKMDRPEIEISIDRNKARNLGVSMDDIATALKIAYGQPETTDFVKNGYTYEVIPQFEASQRNNPEQINKIKVSTSSGGQVPLSTFITIKNIVSPSGLSHFQQQRAATLEAALNPGYSTTEAIQYLQKLAQSMLPSDMSYDYSGQTRQLFETQSAMSLIFIFSLIFIYLILAAQFESFRDPLIVMFSVPLSIVGALATLFFTGASLNIYTDIGLVTLIGLISKHGILIVEFANQLQRKKHLSIKDAVIKAASVRLRPILMTTAAMVIGSLPLALASGAGANARQEIGWTLVGGMSFGTLMTLFVVPTMYSFFARKHQESTSDLKVNDLPSDSV